MKAANESRRGGARIIWLLTALVLVFFGWAHNAPLDEIVRGPGTLVPSSNAQIVQSLEGGILDEIAVREGDVVEPGQTIASLNSTRYLAEVRDFEGQIMAIRAQLMRLRAELAQSETFKLPAEIWDRDPELAASEEQLFIARQQKYQSSIAAAREHLSLQEDQVTMIGGMVSQNAMPAIELLNARQLASELRASRDTLEADYQLERSEDISLLLAELARLTAQVEQSRDQLARSTIASPVRGVVNTLHVSTVGGVVQPGAPIFEITPLNDELLVEARIAPKDIAFVAPEMPSTVKLSAYDYTIYGSLPGKVVQISADTFEDDQAQDAQPYYKVLISVDTAAFSARQNVADIRPGMLADAELHVGEKTVLQYLMKPLLKSSEALREP